MMSDIVTTTHNAIYRKVKAFHTNARQSCKSLTKECVRMCESAAFHHGLCSALGPSHFLIFCIFVSVS